MTPQQMQQVQASWRKLAPNKQTAGRLFYQRLFEQHPELAPLFTGDMEEQADKLMTMVDTAVGALNRIESAVPTIQNLGRRHLDYGVQPEHYDQVGAVLLWTLEQGLGEDFTPELRDAWTEVYTFLADTMKGAAGY